MYRFLIILYIQIPQKQSPSLSVCTLKFVCWYGHGCPHHRHGCPFLAVKDVSRKGITMWLDRLKELRKEKGFSIKQIVEKTKLPEKTIQRIFSGETDNPYVDTIQRIATALDASLDDIFADTNVVVSTETIVEIKETANAAEAERDAIIAENTSLKDEIGALAHEIELLKKDIQYKDEIIAVHNFYNQLLKK